MRTILASTGVAAAVLAFTGLARAAAPNYILVTGPGVDRPILLADWNENSELLAAILQAPRARGRDAKRLERRPRLMLSEFWGWGRLPRPTRPSQTDQHGWFYPAHGGRRAVVEMVLGGTEFPRLATARVLRVFSLHGVPIRL